MQHSFEGSDERSKTSSELSDVEHLSGPDAPHRTVAHLPGIAARLIGERVRTMYSAMVREPVPEQFLELIAQLEKKERQSD